VQVRDVIGMETEELLEDVIEAERLAEQILTDKNQVVDLDRKRNAIREALRDLKRSQDKKVWTIFGNLFIQFPKGDVDVMLLQDRETIDSEITSLRDELPLKVARLREMEGKADSKGFSRLKALSKEDLKHVLPS
jgi:chaperonin cofactor prefoldin